MIGRDAKDEAPQLTSKGESFVLGVALEVAFWLVVGLLWLAFSGGVVGAVIALVVGGSVFVLVRAVVKRSRNPIQSQAPRDEWRP